MIQALMFDLDNTLYSEHTGLEIGVLKRINAFVAEYLAINAEEAVLQRRDGVKHYGTTLEWLMKEKGFSDVERYFAVIHPENEAENLEPDAHLAAMLQKLPYKKIVLTNSPMEHAIRILEVLGVRSLFSGIYDIRFNQLVGKPHPDAFYRVLHAEGLLVEETVFIDDLPKYVQGYRDIGGRAILKDEGDRFAHLGMERIKTVHELPHIL